MVIDHVGIIFFPDIVILRIIGRLSMPLFAYCIARGFSSSRKHGTVEAYIKRMAVFAAVSQIPYMLMVKTIRGNIGVTWLICQLILYLTEKQNKSKKDYFAIAALAVLAAVAPMDYGVYGIGFTVIFYFFYVERFDWNKFLIGFIILHIFALTQTLSFGLFQIFTLPCILGLEMLRKYDSKIKISRKFFYGFYTLHMLCFILIKTFLL